MAFLPFEEGMKFYAFPSYLIWTREFTAARAGDECRLFGGENFGTQFEKKQAFLATQKVGEKSPKRVSYLFDILGLLETWKEKRSSGWWPTRPAGQKAGLSPCTWGRVSYVSIPRQSNKLSKSAALSNNWKERSKPSLGVIFNLIIVSASKGPLWGPL